MHISIKAKIDSLNFRLYKERQIIFWFKFNEKISVITIIGTLLMVPCIVFLAFGADTSASVTEEDEVDPEEYTASQK